MILFEIIKFLAASIVIAFLFVVLVAILIAAWEHFFEKDEGD